MTVLLSTQNLEVSFKRKKLLKNINLEIYQGELVRLAGPNGCGKTSLLEILIGLKNSKNVERNFNNRDYGYLPQMSKVFPKISLQLKDVCDQSYSFYPETLFHRHWSYASGGEKMKALIARTLTQAQKIVFLDEPFNHLDSESCALLADIIQEKVKTGLTVVYIGHNEIEMDQKIIEVDRWSY